MKNYLWIAIVEGSEAVQVSCLPQYCFARGRDSSRELSNKISDDLLHEVPCANLLVIFDGHESPLLGSVLLSHHIPGWGRRGGTANRTPLQSPALEQKSGSEMKERWWVKHMVHVMEAHIMVCRRNYKTLGLLSALITYHCTKTCTKEYNSWTALPVSKDWVRHTRAKTIQFKFHKKRMRRKRCPGVSFLCF